MRVLAFDPGAARCGWAVVDSEGGLDPRSQPYCYRDSGISGLDRGKDEKYQTYRLRLVAYWVERAPELLETHKPDRVITEIVPVVGGGNFVVATQSQLAATAATVIQAIAALNEVEITQVAAGTVKRKIGGVKDASKVKVRNGVLSLFPELEPRRSEFMKVFDETDAIAIAATEIGYWL